MTRTSTSLLELAAIEFFEKRLGGESLDRVVPPLGGPPDASQRADFLLCDRTVVVEIKRLDDPRAHALQRVLDHWRSSPDWPAFVGEKSLGDIARLHPRGHELLKDAFGAVTSSIETHIKKANRQIRDTALAFGLEKPHGVLFLLNETVDVFGPDMLCSKLRDVLTRPGNENGRRFGCIDSALVVSWAHTLEGPDRSQTFPLISLAPDNLSVLDDPPSLERWLMKEWAAFLGKPLHDGGILESAEDVAKLSFKSVNEPCVVDGTRIIRPARFTNVPQQTLGSEGQLRAQRRNRPNAPCQCGCGRKVKRCPNRQTK